MIGKQVVVPGKYNEDIICVIVAVEDGVLYLKDRFGNKLECGIDEIKGYREKEES